MLQLVERAIGLEQRVLDRILRLVADQPPGDRVQARELLLGEQAKALLRTAFSSRGSSISLLKDARPATVIASFSHCNKKPARASFRQRDIAMVFQNYALYPHMSVRKNLGYGLRVRRMPKHEVERRVGEVARMLGIEELLDRRPAALSGGQRQRVAMGRAIVREPAVFLMDEPLSNLDARLRVQMRAELTRLHNRLGITTVYVTHDQVEAMTLGQRVAVMRAGLLHQVDSPRKLFADPANLFVAAFIGSPSMNLVEADVADGEVRFAGFRLPLAPDRRPRGVAAGRVVLGIRPQHLEDARFADPALPSIAIEPAVVEELGSETHVIFPIDAPPVETESVRATSREGEAAAVLLAEDRRALFTAQVSEFSRARIGETMRVAVDPTRFHFFDPETGDSLRRNGPAPPASNTGPAADRGSSPRPSAERLAELCPELPPRRITANEQS
jgi:multiple sugar transport system ATP-binding protein